jgi:putative transposase
LVVRTLGFLLLRRVLGLAGLGPAPKARDVEIAVMRHQVRQVTPPRYSPSDRMILAVLARLLPRDRWSVFWSLLARCCGGTGSWWPRRWTYPHTGDRRRGLDPQMVQVVLRLARENPRWG